MNYEKIEDVIYELKEQANKKIAEELEKIKNIFEERERRLNKIKKGQPDDLVKGFMDYKLRAEAVKWVKEDKRRVEQGTMTQEMLIERWMKRLDLTEKDLEEKE